MLITLYTCLSVLAMPEVRIDHSRSDGNTISHFLCVSGHLRVLRSPTCAYTHARALPSAPAPADQRRAGVWTQLGGR